MEAGILASRPRNFEKNERVVLREATATATTHNKCRWNERSATYWRMTAKAINGREPAVVRIAPSHTCHTF